MGNDNNDIIILEFAGIDGEYGKFIFDDEYPIYKIFHQEEDMSKKHIGWANPFSGIFKFLPNCIDITEPSYIHFCIMRATIHAMEYLSDSCEKYVMPSIPPKFTVKGDIEI
jgi:hypothetical protein